MQLILWNQTGLQKAFNSKPVVYWFQQYPTTPNDFLFSQYYVICNRIRISEGQKKVLHVDYKRHKHSFSLAFTAYYYADMF